MAKDIAAFHALHAGPGLLILPNAWDAGSARLFEARGARAIATTSAGLAWSNGYADGDALPIDVHLAAVRAIVRVVAVPVTIDIESGYANDPAEVAAHARRFADAGASGINIEDGDGAPAALAAKIAEVRVAAPGLFINARTDVLLRGLAPGRHIAEILQRAALYAAAGCDGLFGPGVTKAEDIAALVAGTTLPLNVMARPALPPAAALAAIGVRRLSAGSAIAEAMMGLSAHLATDFLNGSTETLFAGAMPYRDINALMT